MSGAKLCRLLIGESEPMRRLRELIVRIAPSRAPVLIQGPTGAGKELVAEALHLTSGRSGAFVPLNVSAIADSMFEDAMFGHVRGAFTGALGDTLGYLREAHGGTLFLDEIGTLPHQAQAKLLRALDTGRFRPVGDRADRQSDFRLVAAANQDLGALVRGGQFREDLAYRLNGIVLDVPPLRRRAEDIPSLCLHFAQQVRAEIDSLEALLTTDALNVLSRHDWPGNVRELRHVVDACLTMTEMLPLRARDISSLLRPMDEGDGPIGRASFARRRLLSVLDAVEWDIDRAAQVIGVSRATVYRRIQRLEIRREQATPSVGEAAAVPARGAVPRKLLPSAEHAPARR